MIAFVDSLPQNLVPIKRTTLFDVLAVLEEKLPPYVGDVTVWIEGKIVDYGTTWRNLIFTIEQDNETTTEQKMYFANIIRPLGIQATANNRWKNHRMSKLMLYDKGELIIDKTTGTFKKVPRTVTLSPVFTREEVLAKLPKEIPFKEDIYLTGGLVLNDATCSDMDLIVGNTWDDTKKSFEDIPHTYLCEIGKYFRNCLNDMMPVHAGHAVMVDRPDVLLYKIYSGGKCLYSMP